MSTNLGRRWPIRVEEVHSEDEERVLNLQLRSHQLLPGRLVVLDLLVIGRAQVQLFHLLLLQSRPHSFHISQIQFSSNLFHLPSPFCDMLNS